MTGAGDTRGSDAGSMRGSGSGGVTDGDAGDTTSTDDADDTTSTDDTTSADDADDAGTARRSREPPGSAGPPAADPPDTGGRPVRRTRVVLGEAATRRRPTDPARADLAEQTPVGEALVKGLVRAQLALALRLSLVVATSLGALPLLFAVAPDVAHVKVVGVNLPWVLLGDLAFPFLFGVGWAYVRWAERNEQDFTAVIRRPE